MSVQNLDTAPQTFTLIDNRDGRSWDFPVFHGTAGPDVIDIRKLYAETGCFAFDPGYTSTASCESAITYIDGDAGILLHRGYAIEELAEKSNYLEVCQLLLNGELPSAAEHSKFIEQITVHTMLDEKLNLFFQGFRRDSHPMAIMCGVVGALSAFYHESLDIHDPAHRELAINRIIAKMPTIAASAYKFAVGQPFVYPQNNLNYAENFLRMMFSIPCEDYEINPTLARAMDRILILHADHEQNASTSTVRLAGSSQANPYACIASGIASLWGPSHGGANEAVLNMLMEIGDKERLPEFIKRAKDKDDPFRLMGFGHRVYKNYDPRAAILRDSCHEVMAELGSTDEPLLEMAMELERIALEDEYFVDKKLFPNVDFYSGIIYRAMGIPMSMFTVMFAMARTVGWLAQWNEMMQEPVQKIGRPRQLFTGAKPRDFVAIGDR